MRLLSAVLGVLVTLSIGCDGSETLSKEEYVSRLNAVCRDFSEREKKIGEPRTVVDLVEKGPRVVEAFEEAIVDEVHDLKAPDEIAEQADRLADLADEQRDVLGRLVDAATRSDFAKVNELSSENARLNEESGSIASELGAADCADE